MKEALIFTAGLSGMKAYSKRTPKEHRSRLLAEFHAQIRSAAPSDLQLSDTHGDALAFFKEGPSPSRKTIMTWAEDQLKAFQSTVQSYEDARICTCAACTDLDGVVLNFAVYHGPAGFIRIIDSAKLHGEALQQTLALLEPLGEGMGQVALSPSISGPGESPVQLTSLSFSPQAPISPPKNTVPSLKVEVVLHGDLEDAFEMVSNLTLRPEWRPGMRTMDYDKAGINRIGMQHVQLSSLGRSEVRTTAIAQQGMLPGFGEQLSGCPGGGTWTLNYLFKQQGRELVFSMEAHLPAVPLLQRPAMARFKKKVRLDLEASTKRLRAIFV